MSDAKLTAEELERLLSAEFPRMFDREKGVSILKVWHRGCLVRQGFHPRVLVLKLRYGIADQQTPGMAALGSVSLPIQAGRSQVLTLQLNLAF